MNNITLTYEEYRMVQDALIHARHHMENLKGEYLHKGWNSHANTTSESMELVASAKGVLAKSFEKSLENP